jgi:phosphatidylserine/phosphatidylglycerophosphate/cardiolipin synthase-like enzyme
VHVATREDELNRSFISTLHALGQRDGLVIHTSEELHEKGILGDHFYLSGSMNFTMAGIRLNEEAAHLVTDPADIAHHKVIFSHRWGGECK